MSSYMPQKTALCLFYRDFWVRRVRSMLRLCGLPSYIKQFRISIIHFITIIDISRNYFISLILICWHFWYIAVWNVSLWKAGRLKINSHRHWQKVYPYARYAHSSLCFVYFESILQSKLAFHMLTLQTYHCSELVHWNPGDQMIAPPLVKWIEGYGVRWPCIKSYQNTTKYQDFVMLSQSL